jgi:phosphomannomutase
MKETMRAEGCVGGGELSGHFYFADNYYSDCGVLAGLMVLDQLSREGKSLKQAADALRVYHSTGEINFKVDDKDAALKAVTDTFRDGEIDHLDGVTVTYPDWWVNVRPSNTEPFLRMRLEANSAELLEERQKQLIELIGPPADH